MRKYLFLILCVVAALMTACSDKEVPSEEPVADSLPLEDFVSSVDFNAMAADSLSNFKGGEGTVLMKMAQLNDNRVMLATLPKGSSVGFHAHVNDMEVIYVLQGTATILLDSSELVYTPGMAHYCPKGHAHSISNRGDEDLVTYNVVAPQN